MRVQAGGIRATRSSVNRTIGVATQTAWRQVVKKFERPHHGRAIWQIINSFGPYFILWALMVWSFSISYWLTLALMVPAVGFLIRIFIIFHDCCHGSFFRSARANEVVGTVGGLLTFTPYRYWRFTHAVHHATAGNLDYRGVGDVWTMTLAEYEAASFWTRLGFRLYRNPIVMFGLAPFYMFFIHNRFAIPRYGWRRQLSVQQTNLLLLGVLLVAARTIGLERYLLIQVPLMMLAGALGIWLFYVQHQFDGVYWERDKEWSYLETALQGSSFYKLPRVLQFFTGNIGFHHVHHLSPRIPNYYLEPCHQSDELFRNVTPLRVRESLRCLRYRVWDEKRRKLVGLRPLGFLF
ncbi:MAG: fatty acid desaturase [Candidatus Eisenbacteria bacterium]|uniref:Fatty acid desaturase n=1 Tax=Eiseniibacteriota bacterium TaxID=2212470 RepID=A0A956M1F2_UNCEI|nr:fatty acid desaturase [Candidatus Eisenbacteria bacterium]